MSRKKKKSNAKFIVIFFVVCIVAIVLFVYEINSFIKKSKEIKESKVVETVASENPKEEKKELNFDSFIYGKVFKNAEEIEKLTNKELKDIAVNSFDLFDLNYLEVIDSATTANYAIENTKNFIKAKSYSHFVDECKIIADEDLFYGVNVKYRAVSETHDNAFNSNYIVPKTEYYNSKKKILNMDDLTKTKKMLDIMEYISCRNTGKTLIQSFFSREDDGCHYVTYYISSIYSEKINDLEYSLVKETKIVDSASGLIGEPTTEIIREIN